MAHLNRTMRSVVNSDFVQLAISYELLEDFPIGRPLEIPDDLTAHIPDNVIVGKDKVRLSHVLDYSWTDGKTLVFRVPLAAGQIIHITALKPPETKKK